MLLLRSQNRFRLLLVFICLLSLVLSPAAAAEEAEIDSLLEIQNSFFSVLILGDSQMAGAGWEGGYANCIREAYPNAKVFNLAQNGQMLQDEGIYRQWEYFVSKEAPLPDLILLDGGANDLFYLPRNEHTEEAMQLVYEDFAFLLEQIHRDSPDTRIIYMIFPPLREWEDSPHGPPSYDGQDHFWKYINLIGAKYDHVTVLDFFSLNPFRYPYPECYQACFADSIHMNENGYRKTFQYVDNALIGILAGKMQ